MMRILLRLAAAFLLAGLLGACASIPPGAGSNPADPWEVYNRHMFDFNDRVDRAVFKPIAEAYETVLPEGVRVCVNNMFRNIGEPINFINNVLQGKPNAAMTDLCRFLVNTTVGLGGCFDVAAKTGLPRSNEDFGQTLGVWGFGPGPYFVLPLLGPSTVRDSFGRVFDFLQTDPLWFIRDIPLRNSLVGLRVVDARAALLPAEKVLGAAAIDQYEFIRDAFLQLRRNLIYDGEPPPLRLEDDEEQNNPADKQSKPEEPESGQPKAPSAP